MKQGYASRASELKTLLSNVSSGGCGLFNTSHKLSAKGQNSDPGTKVHLKGLSH